MRTLRRLIRISDAILGTYFLLLLTLMFALIVGCRHPQHEELRQVHGDDSQTDIAREPHASIPPIEGDANNEGNPLYISQIKRLIHDVRPMPGAGTDDDYCREDWVYLYALAERLQHEPIGSIQAACKEYVLHFQTAFEDSIDPIAAESKVFVLLCTLFAVPDESNVREFGGLKLEYAWGSFSDDSQVGTRKVFSPVVWEINGPRFVTNRGWGGSGPEYEPAETVDYLARTVGYRADLSVRISTIKGAK